MAASTSDLLDGRAGVDGRFAAYVAHELRTPLTTQRALLELALGDLNTTADCWREIGEEVLEACHQQEHLLDACLALARGRCAEGRRDALDLGPLVGELVQSHSDARVELRATLKPAPVAGDAGMIERLVDNLLGNARRHNIQPGWIEITTGKAGATSLLTVENSGPLIPESEVARLFEPFQRYATSQPRMTEGLGLGLVVTKAVADAHDAVISARARANGGLRVEVAFPVLIASGEFSNTDSASRHLTLTTEKSPTTLGSNTG